MSALLAEFRVALRALTRRPGFTLLAAATLALGLAGAITVGSVAWGILVRPLPYPDSDRLVRLHEVGRDGHRMRFADPNFLDLAKLDGAFGALAEYAGGTIPVRVGDEPLRLELAEVSADFLRAFSTSPRLGRTFAPADLAPGAERVALVGERLWTSRYGAATELAKLRLEVSGVAYRVVGVLPAGFDFPAGTGIWIPREQDAFLTSRTAHNFRVLGKLAEGATLASARRQASDLAARLARENGELTDMADVAVEPLLASLVENVRPALLLELAAAGFLLLVAIANVAGLLGARLETRRRDLATRLALGADARQLARHLLAEAAIVVGLGVALALAVASSGLALLRRLAPATLPRLDAVRIDGPIVALVLLLAVATAFALAAVAARRALSWNVERELREGAAAVAGGGRRHWLRRLPVAFQAAAAVVLLSGVALVGASLLRLLAVAPGFRVDGVTAVEMFPAGARDEASIARRALALSAFAERLAGLPGAPAAGLVSSLPLAADPANGTFAELVGATPPPARMEDFDALFHGGNVPTGNATYLVASEGYFGALGIPLRAGRLFTSADTREAPHVALVSESVARTTWPGESALGRRIEFGNMDGDTRPLTVVGVVADVHQSALGDGPTPAIYVSFRQRPQAVSSWTVVAASSSPAAAEAIRSWIRADFPEAPTRVRTLEGVLAESLADRRLLILLLAVFAAAALGLAAAAVFASVALAVAARTRDYAVRLALGARRQQVVRHALASGFAPVAAGVAAGALVALAGARALRSLLFGIEPRHAPAFLLAATLVLAAAALAAWLPARRAARLDPATALRAD